MFLYPNIFLFCYLWALWRRLLMHRKRMLPSPQDCDQWEVCTGSDVTSRPMKTKCQSTSNVKQQTSVMSRLLSTRHLYRKWGIDVTTLRLLDRKWLHDIGRCLIQQATKQRGSRCYETDVLTWTKITRAKVKLVFPHCLHVHWWTCIFVEQDFCKMFLLF